MRVPALKLAPLRRITSDGSYVPEIDGLRFVAIFSVIVYHVVSVTALSYGSVEPPHNPLAAFVLKLCGHGFYGVELFFIVSGLVLGLPFARHHLQSQPAPRLGNYFLRRLTRLEPPYILNLLIRFPFSAGAHAGGLALALPSLLASLFYLHGVIYARPPLVHLPSWSLEIEVQFYLLAPLLALILFRPNLRIRRTALLFCIAAPCFLLPYHPPVSSRFMLSILGSFQYFVAGLLLADLYVTVLPKLRSSLLWDLATPLWLLIFYVDGPAAHRFLPIMALVVYVAAFKGRWSNAFFRHPIVCTLGGMCYSLYLTHSLALHGADMLVQRIPFVPGYYCRLALAAVVDTPVMLAVGIIFFVVIERPCMDKNWPQKLAVYLRGNLGFQAPLPVPAIPSSEDDDAAS